MSASLWMAEQVRRLQIALNALDSHPHVAIGLLAKPLARWLDKHEIDRQLFCDMIMSVKKDAHCSVR